MCSNRFKDKTYKTIRMPDYSKGKIYRIVVDTEEEYRPYVGSTCQELSQRMTDHRLNYQNWKNGKNGLTSSFNLFERFGVENCKIILLEEYPCDSKMKLLMKEREWFDKMECCNQRRPFTSNEELIEYQKIYRESNKEKNLQQQKEYHQKNKEQIAEKAKIYRESNKEKIIQQQKEYNQKNKEQISEKAKEYYEANKEKIIQQQKEKMTCKCGAIICKGDKARHERSQKHQDLLLSQLNT